jgi:hypothetical protein
MLTDAKHDGLLIQGLMEEHFDDHDPLRWYILRDLHDTGAFSGQKAFEMLASESRDRNSELRGIGSWLRWTQDKSRGER